MRNLIFVLAALTFINLFTSCQKEEIEYGIEELENITPLETNNLTFEDLDIDETEIESSNQIEKDSQVSSRSEDELVYESGNKQLKKGKYHIVYASKSFLRQNEGCSFIAKVARTISVGNPDVFILGYNKITRKFRLIRKSIEGGGAIDESFGSYEDLQENETHLAFAVKARATTQFNMLIFKECTEEQVTFILRNVGFNLTSAPEFAEHVHKMGVAGSDVYIKADAIADSGIKKISLSINGRMLKEELHTPYEWGRPVYDNQNELSNIQPGSYILEFIIETNRGTVYKQTQGLTIVSEDAVTPRMKAVVKSDLGGTNSNTIHSVFFTGTSLYVSAEVDASEAINKMTIRFLSGSTASDLYQGPFEWGFNSENNYHPLNSLPVGRHPIIIEAHGVDGTIRRVVHAIQVM